MLQWKMRNVVARCIGKIDPCLSVYSHFWRYLNWIFFSWKWEKSFHRFPSVNREYPKQIQNPNPDALLRASTLHVLYIWGPNMSRQFSAVWLEGRRIFARRKFLIERVKPWCHFSKWCPEFMHSNQGCRKMTKFEGTSYNCGQNLLSPKVE